MQGDSSNVHKILNTPLLSTGTLIIGPFKMKRTSAQIQEYPKLSIESLYAPDDASFSLTTGDIFCIPTGITTAYHISQTSNVFNSAKTGKVVREIYTYLISKQSVQIRRNLETSEKRVF